LSTRNAKPKDIIAMKMSGAGVTYARRQSDQAKRHRHRHAAVPAPMALMAFFPQLVTAFI